MFTEKSPTSKQSVGGRGSYGNIDHSEEHNMKLIQKYKERIPLLVKSVSYN
jgi:hypothetical protein